MSINHFSSELPGTIWWTQQQQQQQQKHHQSSVMERIPQNTPFHHGQNSRNTPFNFNLNQEDEIEEKEMKLEEAIFVAKEAMFEKPLTPSDVGKLNRLVIPKQHAEKYFPLGGNNGSGGDSVEKGVLLSFEDESGKTWRFRYSYWNSSQSYVLTKGWSRFVKEKRLEAGDVVVFDRFRTQGDRFFIGWRRRNAAVPENTASGCSTSTGGWNRVYYSGYPYPAHPNGTTSLPYQTHCPHAAGGGGGGSSAGGTQNQTGGNPKTVLRLFGVNLECQSDEPDGSSQREGQGQHYYNVSNHHAQMQDTNFSRTR